MRYDNGEDLDDPHGGMHGKFSIMPLLRTTLIFVSPRLHPFFDF